MLTLFSLICDQCDSDYVGLAVRHPIHQRAVEHKTLRSANTFGQPMGIQATAKKAFRIVEKYQGKFDCLVYEMFFIRECNPSLKTQTRKSCSLKEHSITHCPFSV